MAHFASQSNRIVSNRIVFVFKISNHIRTFAYQFVSKWTTEFIILN
jgi:hypothetical protein